MDCNEDAILLAGLIVQLAERVTPYFERALTQASKVSTREVLPQIKLELCVLYLHLLEKDAFSELGEELRARFMRAVFASATERLQKGAAMSPSQCFETLMRLWSERPSQYSAFRDLLPPPGESLGGTLFWEFGKKMGLIYHGYNPVALQLFILGASDGYIALREAVQKLAIS